MTYLILSTSRWLAPSLPLPHQPSIPPLYPYTLGGGGSVTAIEQTNAEDQSVSNCGIG